MIKILLVEDDALMVRAYEKAFRFDGHEIMIASNGLEGLEKLKESLPNLILLDLMMPKMSGMEFLEKIKADEKTKHIPVVILTNLAGENDAKFGLSKGAIKYIVKSDQDPQEVVKMVKEILTKGEMASPPEKRQPN